MLRPRRLKDEESYEAMAFVPALEGKMPLLLYLHGAGEMRGVLDDIISEAPPVDLDILRQVMDRERREPRQSS